MTATGLNDTDTTARIPASAPDCGLPMPARAKPGQRRVEELERCLGSTPDRGLSGQHQGNSGARGGGPGTGDPRS